MMRIIPTPKRMEIGDSFLCLSGLSVYLNRGTDSRVIRAAAELCEEIGKAAGEIVALSFGEPCGKALVLSCGDVGEGYELDIRFDGINIRADGAAGAFYAIQSLRQMVVQSGAEIPFCHLEDAPDFQYRGFYHDITRGRVPTLEKLKSIADTLAFYKINSLQLYVEDAFTFKELEGIITPECALTPAEIMELDGYCRERFIDLIPSMSTFGHLFTLLQSEKYNHICELKGHELTRNYWLERQWHHTVDVYNPETIKVIGSMIEQYIPLFSSKYFNICCDETMDLCNGANEGCEKGEAYFYHLNKLIEIVSSYGKTVMLWGDECMARPDMAKENLPDNAIVLNWCYRKSVAEWIPKMFWERDFTQIVCTGTSCWENFIENVDISVGNIESFAAHGKKYGVLGLLNTNWGDFGHVCPFNCNLYGMLFGAEKSWNVQSVTDEEFEMAASLLLYGVREFNVAELLRALARAGATCNWSEFVIWHSARTLEGKERPLGFGFGEGIRYGAGEAIESVVICRDALEKLYSLKREDSVITDLILSVRALILMNREVLFVNGVGGYDDKEALQRDFDLWLSEYSSAWLRDDKPSGLGRIQDFIKKITDVPLA